MRGPADRSPEPAVARAFGRFDPGFMKVLVGANDHRILGFTMIGADAGEVMATMQTAMLAGLPYPKLREAVIAHLTTAEGLWLLLENVPPR